jgi:hypothetical protein
MNRLAPKGLPRIRSVGELVEPWESHEYFENAERVPFPAAARGWDPALGWWLAELSLLTYVADEDRVRGILARAGFAETFFLSEESTHALVTARRDAAVVAFRGTEPLDLRNLLTDIRFAAVTEGDRGLVHVGFRDALDLLWPRLPALLEGDRPLWFTGHSLGAALATLAAARHGRGRALYTFGSPRVGDVVFRDRFPLPAFRVVNGADLVTRVPVSPPYRHVGERLYLDRRGRLLRDTTRLERFADGLGGSPVDHSPVHYAVRMWNHLVAELNARS